ncbi:DUF4352 domain-containing protein [Allobranchiibius huperziae]|uniref:DUF4352 domain-containing protein n=1 Tax=Allobranchiibius huperziae TaxID=1874116 RepID=A0A853DLY8_9MICO|nr:DUF4352 domain-containing protein [Allobranchiibius huperziae]NYJ75145.1 hypothetical protein [Allobranchiibius huperziae]
MTYLLTRRGGRGVRRGGRRVRLAVVASAIGSVGVLTGCGAGTDAPTVVTPSRDIVTSVTSAPSTTSSSTTSACGSSLEFGPTTAPSTKSHRFGTTAQTTDADSDDVRLAVTVQAPKVVSAVTEDPPDDGYQYVAVSMSVTLTGGDSTYIGAIDTFSMIDAQGNRCDYRDDSGAIPAAQVWKDGELNARKKSETGSMVFQVPIATKPSMLTVAFVGGLNETATDRWTD